MAVIKVYTALEDVWAGVVDDGLAVMVMETGTHLEIALSQWLDKTIEDNTEFRSVELTEGDFDVVKPAVGDG